MENENKISFQNNLYWFYMSGFFLVIIQILNIIPIWSAPNDWGKAIFSRIIISILLFLFLWQIINKKIGFSYINAKIKSAISPIRILGALFLLFLLATVFSVNPHFSLWGDPNRNGGFVNFAFYIIFAILAFLIIREKDWKKILNFLIIISFFVCILAFFQKFGILTKYFVSFENRVISTMGNPILLAIYLVLVSFITLSLGLIEKKLYKKIFYLFCFFLFLLVNVFYVQTRGVYLGLATGFLWFIFAYPGFKNKKAKLYIGIGIVAVILILFCSKVYLDSHLDVYNKLPVTFGRTLDRALSLFEGPKITEARTSVWKVSMQAFMEKPILGWGPENFMVAFDKYYDPFLPVIGNIAPGDNVSEWFDRAHNIVIETAITGGIFALFAYLSFLGVLIWQLEKAKKRNPEDAIMITGLEATFLAYFVSLLTAFDSVSTYLIFFLLVGYAIYFISKGRINNFEPNSKIIDKLYKYRAVFLPILFIALIWFLWTGCITPLFENKDMNTALAFADSRTTKYCEIAYDIVNKLSPSIPQSTIDNYLGQKSTFIIYGCDNFLKKQKIEDLLKQNIDILKGNIDRNPYLVTNWIIIGEYTNILIKQKNMVTENVFVETLETKKLKEDADYYFTKALEMSPKRQLILKDWADTQMITGEYKKAEENLNKCIDLNPSYARCYWYMALNKGYQKDYNGFNEFYQIAKEKNYGVDLLESLQEIVNMYIRNSDYKGLSEIYPKMIPLTADPLERAQLHASLAASYKELGDIKKAREEVLKIRDIIPLLPLSQQKAVENEVEEFLKILK